MAIKHAALAGILAGLVLSQPVAAADLGGGPRRTIKDAPLPYAPSYTWTGLYIGSHAGYAWSDVDWQFALTPGVATDHTGSGGLLGAQIGYNVQAGQFVFGIEADISSAWLDGSTPCPGAGFSCEHSVNWLASLRGRAGIAVNANRTLLYVTAGGAWADVEYAAVSTATGAPFGTGVSETHSGWVGGAGLEHMLAPNITARVEYLYYGFEGAAAPAGALGAGAAGLDLTTQTIRFGLNLKF